MGGRSSSFGKKAGGGAKLDLPELEGSEKQIKWAKDIRQEIIDKVNQFEKNGKVGDFAGGWHPQFTNQANLTYFARHTNMGHDAPDDVDFPQFEPGGKFKEWMKSDFEDFKNFPLSKNEAAVERPAVKNYYNSAMSTYNRYAPKGKYPETASREVRNRYEQKESQAYRKTLAAMVRKGLNKETKAAEYIDRYRYNWNE